MPVSTGRFSARFSLMTNTASPGIAAAVRSTSTPAARGRHFVVRVDRRVRGEVLVQRARERRARQDLRPRASRSSARCPPDERDQRRGRVVEQLVGELDEAPELRLGRHARERRVRPARAESASHSSAASDPAASRSSRRISWSHTRPTPPALLHVAEGALRLRTSVPSGLAF